MALPFLFLGAGLGWIAERTFGSASTREANETLRQKLASSQAQVSHLQSVESEVEQLRTQLAGAQALVVELQSKQQAGDGSNEQIIEKLNRAEARIGELQAAEQTLTQQLADGQAQISQMAASGEASAQQLADAQAQISQMGAVGQDTGQQLADAQAQISQMETAAEESALQLAGSEARIKQMEAAAEESALQLAEAHAKIRQMEVVAQELAQQSTEAQAKISQMELDSKDAKLARVSQMQAAQQVAEQLQHELGNAQAKIKQLQASKEEANHLREQMAIATAQISQMQADQEAAAQELAYAAAQISQLEDASTERSLPSAEDNTSSIAEEEVETLRKKLIDTESQIFNLQAKLDIINSKNKIDDLEEIRGIGPTLEQRFYKAGIHSYGQLAQLTIAQVEEIASIKNRQRIESLLEQARDLASEA